MTIKTYDASSDDLSLEVPNSQTKQTLANDLLQYFDNRMEACVLNVFRQRAASFTSYIEVGDLSLSDSAETLADKISDIFAHFNLLSINNEQSMRNVLDTILLQRFGSKVVFLEKLPLQGRIDRILSLMSRYVCIEYKQVDRASSKEAFDQIADMD